MNRLNDPFNSSAFDIEEQANKRRRLNNGQSMDIYSQEESAFTSLPEDLILRIFSSLSLDTLKKLPLVCKTFNLHVNNDPIIWQSVYKILFCPNDIGLKPVEIPFSKYCQSTLVKTEVGNEKLEHLNPFILAPRDPNFVKQIQNMQLPDYKLLTPLEVKSLMLESDTIGLMSHSQFPQREYSNTIYHMVRQKINNKIYEFFNYTDYVVSIDSSFKLKINSLKLDITIQTNLWAEARSSQDIIFIHMRADKMFIIDKERGNESVQILCCNMEDIRKGNFTVFRFISYGQFLSFMN